MSEKFNFFGADQSQRDVSGINPMDEPKKIVFYSDKEHAPTQTLGWIVTATQTDQPTLYLKVSDARWSGYSWTTQPRVSASFTDQEKAISDYMSLADNLELPEGYNKELVEFKVQPLMLGFGVKIEPPKRG